MSLIICAPASSAASATSDFCVSIETGNLQQSPQRLQHRHTRASSSLAETPVEPGRVDSPPIFQQVCSGLFHCQSLLDGPLRSKNFPPSENCPRDVEHAHQQRALSQN